jgi:SHS2 domain-containing protein
MKKHIHSGIEIEIDELTNSIKNVISGDSFPTDITLITSSDLKTVTKKNGWHLTGK